MAEEANRFAHNAEPWKHLDDAVRVQADLSVLLHTIYNLALLVQPFLPKTSNVIQGFFGLDTVQSVVGVSHTPSTWRYVQLPETTVVRDAKPLFSKVEDADVQVQLEKLQSQCV